MDVIAILLLILITSYLVVNFICNSNSDIPKNYLWVLLSTHFLFSLVYFIYAGLTTSDSYAYYRVSSASSDWFVFLETGSPFIRFMAWPFTGLMHLSYYSVMLIFSYLGYLGIVLFYIAAKENIVLLKVKNGLTILEWVFLLPNIHFWSSSLGKGSVMVLGIGFFVYGLSRFNYRIIHILVGSIIIYFTRPHILFASIGGIIIGLVFAGKGINRTLRYSLIAIALVAVYILTDKVLEFADTDSVNILNSKTLAHKASELGKSTSGIDLSSYNPLTKILTFWFRPLFVDAPGVMGLIVSFENVLMIIFFFSIVKVMVTKWRQLNGWFLICLFVFLLGSFALSQVSGNLGIALRQKAQLMPLFFILYAKGKSMIENT